MSTSWSKVGDWLKGNAGSGVALVGSLLTGNVPGAIAAGVAMVSSSTGTDDPKEALAVLQQDPDSVLKLKELYFKEEDSVRKHLQEMTRLELSDTQDAREKHKDSKMPGFICVFLTVTVVAFGASLMWVKIPPENVRILDTLFGTFLTAWLGSITYWIGTTRGSAQKTAMLNRS